MVFATPWHRFQRTESCGRDSPVRHSETHDQDEHGPRKVKELPGLPRAIEVYEGRQLTRLAMKLMALTFVRTSELIGARWEEFDVEARRWSVPATRMKMKYSAFRAIIAPGD